MSKKQEKPPIVIKDIIVLAYCSDDKIRQTLVSKKTRETALTLIAEMEKIIKIIEKPIDSISLK